MGYYLKNTTHFRCWIFKASVGLHLQSSQMRLQWHFVAGRPVPPGLADQRTLCSNFIISVDFLFQRFNGIAFLKRIEAG